MQKKHEQQGFVLIAQHRQASSLKEKVMSLARSQKINYTVTQGGNIPGDTSKGIPHAYLFDWTGKCVASGHPSSLYSKVDELMLKAPPWITGGKELKSAAVRKIANKLRLPTGWGKALKELEKLKSGADGAEATYLADRIKKHGQELLAKAQAAEEKNALVAYAGYASLSKIFKGHELGDQAAKRLKELKKDKPFQKELKASKYVAQMEFMIGKLKAVGGKIDPNHPVNRRVVKTLAGLFKKLKSKYGDTKAFARAAELLKPYGF